MEVEKRKSKGGFLNLFDWNGKSRKKLFANNSELAEGLKQGKENVGNFAKSQPQMMEVDENGASSGKNTSSDYNCASPVASDEGYGAKVPGVVARLMGLDSLPTSNVPGSCSTSFFNSSSLREPHYDRSIPDFQGACHPMEYINMPNKLEKFSQNTLEFRSHKMQTRPIEKFQTEPLPPKSAKSIPITHHKRLSPIKSPGFIPTKNVAYIVEAAAKIIERSPRINTKGKVPSIGSTSVPLKIRDLKEKMEAEHKASRPQRPNEPSASKYIKIHSRDKGRNGSENMLACRASVDSEKLSPDCSKNKGKSVSLAVQAKVNVQRREGPTSSSSSSYMNQKEQSEVKTNQVSKSQPSTQRPAQKQTKNVLRQNNQKQNSVPNKEKSTSKTSGANQQPRKAQSVNGSIGPNKTVNKVVVNSETGSRKMVSVASDTKKELSSSKTKSFCRMKPSVHGDVQYKESVVNNLEINNDERSIKCNVEIDGCMNWGAENRKMGMDIVSFTFTSPIKRSISESQSSSQVMERSNSFGFDSSGKNDQSYSKNFALYSPGLNVIGGDALSLLLEQKLKELTYRVESSHCNVDGTGSSASSASSLQDSGPGVNVVSTSSREHDPKFEIGMHRDISASQCEYDCSSSDSLQLNVNHKLQGLEEVEEQSDSSNNSANGKELDSRHPSPVSILESSFESRSCSDNRNNTNNKGSKECALVQVQDACNWLPRSESLLMEGELELSDSASTSTADMGRKHPIRKFSFIELKGSLPGEWELAYVRDILDNAELLLEDFALGRTHMVIIPNLFDQLENQGNPTERNGEECSKLNRKVLFDCVSECLAMRCDQLFVGSCKSWAKWATLFQRKGWLADELYKEIFGWKSMEELMVDELVDKDMSTQNGRWIDFDLEAFEEGVEIEKGILISLVDELVSEFLIF